MTPLESEFDFYETVIQNTSPCACYSDNKVNTRASKGDTLSEGSGVERKDSGHVVMFLN